MGVETVADAEAASAFVDVGRTQKDRVVLTVGGASVTLKRWGTLLVTALVADGPALARVTKVLRPRRIKRPRSASLQAFGAATSTAVAAPPLGQGPVEMVKPNRAAARAEKRARKLVDDPSLVALDAAEARAFAARAFAVPDPIVATFRGKTVTLTDEGSAAVLRLFGTSKVRLALAHVMLGADAYRPKRAASDSGEAADPSDPWGPFPGDSVAFGE